MIVRVRMWRNWLTHKLLVGVYNGTAVLETWQFLIKLNMQLPSDPATALLGIYSREMKIYDYTKTCTQISKAALSTVKPRMRLGIPQQVNGSANCTISIS